MDREYILEKLGKIDVLPTFSGTVGEVINIIEDPMNSATDLVKSMDPSIEHTIEIVGLQKAKEDREHTIVISLGNMFAKKIKIGDNFSGFYEFINKYRDFVCAIEDLGTKLTPAEKVTFFNVYLYC